MVGWQSVSNCRWITTSKNMKNATKCRWLITIYGGYGYKMAIKHNKTSSPFFILHAPNVVFSQFMNRSTTLHPSSGGFLESCGSWCCPLMAPLGPWTLHWDGEKIDDNSSTCGQGPKSQNPGEEISSNLHPLEGQDPAFGKAPSASSAPCSASKPPGSCRCISCSPAFCWAVWGEPENRNVCNENLEFEEEKLEVPVFTHKNEHIKPAQIGMEPTIRT